VPALLTCVRTPAFHPIVRCARCIEYCRSATKPTASLLLVRRILLLLRRARRVAQLHCCRPEWQAARLDLLVLAAFLTQIIPAARLLAVPDDGRCRRQAHTRPRRA
jgi:hypothetical protein